MTDREIIMENARKLIAGSAKPSAHKDVHVARAWERELHCEALAVNPEDVAERKKVDERKGLKVAGYDENGCPVFTNKRDYDEYIKSEGCHQRGTHYRKKKRLGKVVIY